MLKDPDIYQVIFKQYILIAFETNFDRQRGTREYAIIVEIFLAIHLLLNGLRNVTICNF